MSHYADYEYVKSEGMELFTLALLPRRQGQFPTVIYRTPYVDHERYMPEEELCRAKLEEYANWLDAGYAVVYQHCRGRGKSQGDCVPFLYERADGLALQDWIRARTFYNGELYLLGGSYTSIVHYVTAPYAPDIKGAVLEIQDTEIYNCVYRNGVCKSGLFGDWYVGMYKANSGLRKSFVPESYNMLPLSEFSRTVFGEQAEAYDELLKHPDREDPFWSTRMGGGEASNALTHANIPVLMTTGLYDIYTGGIFDMWWALDESTRSKCALAVQPYDHGGSANGQPVRFENGSLTERFGDYRVKWMDHIRGKGESPFPLGKVTYYKLFGETWCCDDFDTPQRHMDIPIGQGERTYCYNPYAPASFRGGLSANFGGAAYQDPANSRYDILSFYSPEFQQDCFVKGRMRARLTVKTNCEDTCFYMRLSLCKAEGDYGLRDDINTVANIRADYVPGTELEMDFTFDEHAFVIHRGEKLRVDISSSAFPHYVRHTNRRGLFSEQTSARAAENTVVCDRSFLRIFLE